MEGERVSQKYSKEKQFQIQRSSWNTKDSERCTYFPETMSLTRTQSAN